VQPPVIGAPAKYEISFKTSAGGSLEGGSDTITVTFPRGTTVPDSISRSDITVNGETLDSRSFPSAAASYRPGSQRCICG